ncbi:MULTISPECIES: GPO family capsid scaffolding protein [Nostocales]|uniref:GPO family capsid scaffolding protein n=4 Tax=Nostocales TaxID=1161 RepID=A0A8S9TCL3_9CYAN|nr:GPO family capsid scaffolding protein [Tolypothrix bouteillei]KAF3889747.1 GPO family capsid scaffolding protein [Tolypothrix bouteillei VB521301]
MKSPSKQSPPSQMLRVPTVLIPVVKELARLHREGHTKALLQGLQDLITNIDSNSDSDFGTDSEAVRQLVERVEELESRLTDLNRDTDSKSIAKLEKSLGSLEQKLEAVTLKITILEGAVVQKQYGQRKGYRTPYNNPYVVQQPLELQPFTEENLARRLAVEVSTLIKQRKNLSEVEFEKWSRGRDTSKTGWRYKDDGLYHPISQ